MASTLYKDLTKEAYRANSAMQAAIAARTAQTPGSDAYLFYDALSRAEQAKALVLSQELDNLLLVAGAKDAISQYNNGQLSIKELVETLLATEASLLGN